MTSNLPQTVAEALEEAVRICDEEKYDAEGKKKSAEAGMFSTSIVLAAMAIKTTSRIADHIRALAARVKEQPRQAEPCRRLGCRFDVAQSLLDRAKERGELSKSECATLLAGPADYGHGFGGMLEHVGPQAAQPQVPEGYVLVPVSPTSEMVECGYRSYKRDLSYSIVRDIYRAMLAAAPKEKL